MNVPVRPNDERAYRQESAALLVKYLPTLETVTTTAATSIAAELIVFTEAGFDVAADRMAIVRVLTDLIQIVRSGNPIIAAQALGLLNDTQTSVLEANAAEMRVRLTQAGLRR